MSALTLKLDNLTETTDPAPLHSQYPGQYATQPDYVEMTKDGEVSADFSGEIGNSQPADVWQGMRLQWSVVSSVRGAALATLLRGEALPLLERIYTGHRIHWDGSNDIGTLDADATDASESLQALLDDMQSDESAIAPVWDAREWLFSDSPLAVHWAGGPLADAVTEVRRIARGEGLQVDGDIAQCLLTEARRVYDEDDGTLTAGHLAALVTEREITQPQADDYRDDHDIKDAPIV